MMDTLEQCPVEVEQVAESYCMGTLPTREATAFEDHYVTCNHCATVVKGTDSYIRAIRDAARNLRN